MRVERLNESAVIVRDLPARSWRIAEWLNSAKWANLEEAVASYETVGLYFRDVITEPSEIRDELSVRLVNAKLETQPPRKHAIPVCYELGEDLEVAASRLDITRESLIDLHLSVPYECFAVGFSPGFAYLGYLPDNISSLTRLSTPRSRVEPGSVGITGRQTAVYPSATPGGWNLIGRCPLTLVDVADGFFPIRAGDEVRFIRIDESQFLQLEGERL